MSQFSEPMIIFLHIPKTAGTSFRFILENNFPLSHCHANHASIHPPINYAQRKIFSQADLDFAKKVFPKLRSISGHNLIAPTTLSASNPFFMTFLREPVARVLSQYQERNRRNLLQGRPAPDFEEALRNDTELKNLHVKLMAGEENLDKAKQFLEKCSFVGLTEKFDLSLRVLERIYPGKLDLNYQKRRVQKDNSIKKSLETDARLMEMAREYNRLDVELYSFAATEIFPKLCEKASLNPSEKIAPLNSYTHRFRLNIFLNRFYNQSIYRQLCKIRSRRAG